MFLLRIYQFNVVGFSSERRAVFIFRYSSNLTLIHVNCAHNHC